MKKKVLFVIESLSGGGAEKVLTTIVKNIDKTKFDITVLTIVKTGIYVEEIEKKMYTYFNASRIRKINKSNCKDEVQSGL